MDLRAGGTSAAVVVVVLNGTGEVAGSLRLEKILRVYNIREIFKSENCMFAKNSCFTGSLLLIDH